MRKMFFGIIICVMTLLSIPAFACYGGLLVIPTTDTSGDGNFVIDLHWEGWGDGLKEKHTIINTEFGITDRFEFGVDFNLKVRETGSTPLFNAKYLLVDREDWGFRLAGGIYNLNQEGEMIPYLIATKDFKYFRVHGGLQREYDGKTHCIIGLDKITGNGWQFCVDKISGDDNYLSCGIGWANDLVGFMGGCQWPNGGGKPELVFHVIITLGMKRPQG